MDCALTQMRISQPYELEEDDNQVYAQQINLGKNIKTTSPCSYIKFQSLTIVRMILKELDGEDGKEWNSQLLFIL